ncbi:MAG: hypothetical protein ACJARE_002373 [Paracoccaceae bacterium]
MDRYEMSRILAIHPGGARLVLGTRWSLRACFAECAELWHRAAADAVWAVNISADGRYVVAAYREGTIRLQRANDGAEFLAFSPCADGGNWVVWAEHEGAVSYAARPGAYIMLRWRSGPVTVWFRSLESDTRHQGDQTWHRDTATNLKGMRRGSR